MKLGNSVYRFGGYNVRKDLASTAPRYVVCRNGDQKAVSVHETRGRAIAGLEKARASTNTVTA